jgi:Tfp pilus assembly protein FimT
VVLNIASRVSAGGFTLVEILVVLTLTVVGFLVAAPFTAAWVDSSRVVEARAALQQAYTQARAVALRNGEGAIGDAPAAVMCMASGVPAGCGTAPLWRQAVPGGAATAMTLGGQAVGCVAFANTGRMVAFSLSGANCATDPAFLVSRGGENVAGTLR